MEMTYPECAEATLGVRMSGTEAGDSAGKESGIGRTHSAIGLRDLCETRHVNHDRVALAREVWWYPYKEATFRTILRGARLLFGKRFWQR